MPQGVTHIRKPESSDGVPPAVPWCLEAPPPFSITKESIPS